MEVPTIVLEHPSGEFGSVLEAIEEAFERIRGDKYSGLSIVLSGQGQEGSGERYRIADVTFAQGVFTFERPVPQLDSFPRAVGIASSEIEVQDGGRILVVRRASSKQLARLLDSIYRQAFGIRPFEGERDYAFGAEVKRDK